MPADWRSKDTDRKSTRVNSSHAEIYALSLHDALPIWPVVMQQGLLPVSGEPRIIASSNMREDARRLEEQGYRSEEHTCELQSRRDLRSFSTRRSSDLAGCDAAGATTGLWRAAHYSIVEYARRCPQIGGARI